MKTIEDAEKAYFLLIDKKIKIDNKQLKVNIHSASNFTRTD